MSTHTIDSGAPESAAQPQVIYVKQAGNGYAVGALITALAGVAFGLGMALFYPFALALGAAALGLSIAAIRRARKPQAGGRGMARTALALSLLALLLGGVGASMINSAVEDLNKASDCLANADTLAEVEGC